MGASDSKQSAATPQQNTVTVLAPATGMVVHVSEEAVLIYVAPEDKRAVYAPIAGRVKELLSPKEGEDEDGSGHWRPLLPLEQTALPEGALAEVIFCAFEQTRGRVTCVMSEARHPQICLSFWLEMCGGDVPVDAVRLPLRPQEWLEPAGKRLGETPGGSLCQLNLPGAPTRSLYRTQTLVKPGQRVLGGQTSLARLHVRHA